MYLMNVYDTMCKRLVQQFGILFTAGEINAVVSEGVWEQLLCI